MNLDEFEMKLNYLIRFVKQEVEQELRKLNNVCIHDPGYEGDLAVEVLCKHCGVKLRATGWEEVK